MLAHSRHRKLLTTWVALLVEQALPEPDPAVRRGLAQRAEAERKASSSSTATWPSSNDYTARTVDQGAMTRCFGRRSQTLLCQRVLLLARVQPRWRYMDGAPLGLSS